MNSHKFIQTLAAFFTAWTLFWTQAKAATTGRQLRVGPTQQYPMPSNAATVAQDGDTIEIDAGEYSGDVAVWSANRLTIRGVNGVAHLAANGKSAQQKALWIIRGNDTTVEYIDFSGCHVPDHNGAGIRQEGENLVVRHCSFHDNENGILTGANPESEISIKFTEFHELNQKECYPVGGGDQRGVDTLNQKWCYPRNGHPYEPPDQAASTGQAAFSLCARRPRIQIQTH